MNNPDNFPGLTPEEKVNAENEVLKLKLQAEFGMNKMGSSVNPDIENVFLNNVYSFEKQFAECKRCKVYDFISQPEFIKADRLNKEEISNELEKLMEIMQSNGIELSTICDYEDEVIYRFITEEFFETETDDMRIEGMMHCFIYEDFHPNHDYDLRKLADEFLEFLISKKWDEFMNNIMLASTVSYNDKAFDKNTFPPIIKTFQSEHFKMKLITWKISSVVFDLKTEVACLEGFIEYKSINSEKIFKGKVDLGFSLEYDYWSISKVDLPGFSS